MTEVVASAQPRIPFVWEISTRRKLMLEKPAAAGLRAKASLLYEAKEKATKSVKECPMKEIETLNARVLVVDDEPLIADVVSRHLKCWGCGVKTAESGQQAMSIIEMGKFLPEQLITDVVMDGMSGVQLAEKMRERIPNLATLFISGYVDEVAKRIVSLDDGIHFLPKPFSPAALRNAVQVNLKKTARRA